METDICVQKVSALFSIVHVRNCRSIVPAISTPAVVEDVFYFGDWLASLYALEAVTGSQMWVVKTGPALKTVDLRLDGGIVSSPVVVDGVVYFGSPDGKLYAVSTK
jgi:eukaryotic-like serine/threonine-protein kinase